MLSTSVIILEYVCPLFGVITAGVMFAAPIQDAKRASDAGYLGDLNPTPWAFMLGNTAGWVTYSFVIQNLFVFFANAPGFLFSVWLNMVAVKLQYQSHRATEMRQSFANYLVEQSQSQRFLVDDDEKEEEKHNKSPHTPIRDFAKIVWELTTSQTTKAPAAPHENLVLFMVLVWVGVAAILAFGSTFAQSTREYICGGVVNLNLIFFYGAPLSTIWIVLTTQSSSTIHIPTMITNTCNGAFWTAYGLAVNDAFLYGPNGLGAALGVVQMILCLLFPRKSFEGEDGLPIQEQNASTDRMVDDNGAVEYKQSAEEESSGPTSVEKHSV